MFSADLSWADDTVEKVGQRKGRKHKGREASESDSLSSNNTQKQKRNTSVSKKPTFSSVKGSFRRPSAPNESRKREPLPTSAANGVLRDPLQQPDWILTAKLPSKLTSDAPLEPPPPFIEQYTPKPQTPIPGRILYSRETNITTETIPIGDAAHRAWSVRNPSEADHICRSYEQVKHEILALRTKPDVLLTETKLQSEFENVDYTPSELDAQDNQIPLRAPPEKNPRRYAVSPVPPVEPILELPSLASGLSVRSLDDTGRNNISPGETSPLKDSLSWQAPSSWDIVHGSKSPTATKPTPSGSNNSTSTSHGEDRRPSNASHFQRFVRRMQAAGPGIILDRLKEEWNEPADLAMSRELQLEKHLWALIALQLRALDRFLRPSESSAPTGALPPFTDKKRRRILELDGNLGEVYQLSALYPHSKIAHLTSTPANQAIGIPLPSQAIHHQIDSPKYGSSSSLSSGAGLLPLPYASASMHHIRSSRMASLLPAAQIPELLAEFYRVLKPGGVLELRLMDATPERGSMGPRLATWLEERLLLGLEREFLCQRPVMMLPRWASEAGFQPLSFRNESDAQGLGPARNGLGKLGIARCLRLPAAAQEREQGSRDIVAQVGVLVGRALWKDVWGPFVHEDFDENWWWDNPEVVQECREWKTVWDVGTLCVVKEERT